MDNFLKGFNSDFGHSLRDGVSMRFYNGDFISYGRNLVFENYQNTSWVVIFPLEFVQA